MISKADVSSKMEAVTTSVATIAISDLPSEDIHTSQKATTSTGGKSGVKRCLTEDS